MIERYADPAIERIWSEETKIELWCLVEAAYLNEIGYQDEAAALFDASQNMTMEDVASVAGFEARTGHDVIGFLYWASQHAPHVHVGLTASDIVDTANAMRIQESAQYVGKITASFLEKTLTDAVRCGHVVQTGLTHGQPSTLVTWASRTARWTTAIAAAGLLAAVWAKSLPSKIAGPTGMHLAPATRAAERGTLNTLHVKAVPNVGQTVPRWLVTEMLWRLAVLAHSLGDYAMDLRFLHQRGEVSLGGSTTSSSMPGKENPAGLEKVCGLGQYLGYVAGGSLSTATLWMERDLTHSAVDRLTLPDAFHIVAHQVSTLYPINPRPLPSTVEIEPTVRHHHLRGMQMVDGLTYKEAHESIGNNLYDVESVPSIPDDEHLLSESQAQVALALDYVVRLEKAASALERT